MDTSMNAPQTDLIAQKTSEYDNLPGLVLGLDGWLLRSIPAQLRDQFLNGYEKLLRIVFHPDRYTDPEKKRTRENYLQSVNEAIRFMLADEFSFETIVDTVPTRRNPLVALRHNIELRDSIIGRLDDRSREASQIIERLSKENEAMKLHILQVSQNAELKLSAAYHLRRIVNVFVKRYPVAIGMMYCVANVREVVFTPDFMEQLGLYSSSKFLTPDHEWIQKHSWANQLGVMGKRLKFKIERRTAKSDDENYTVVGAMSIAHLCEYLRYTSDTVQSNLERLKNTAADSMQQYVNEVAPFVTSFYTGGMMLLVIKKEEHKSGKPKNPKQFTLFYVVDVDAETNPNEALVRGYERRISHLNAARLRDLAHMEKLRRNIKVLKLKLKKSK